MKLDLLTLSRLGDKNLLLQAIEPRLPCDVEFLSRFLSFVGNSTESMYYVSDGWMWALQASRERIQVLRLSLIEKTEWHPAALFYTYGGKNHGKHEYWEKKNET